MSHNETIALIKKMITDFKALNEERKKMGPQPMNPRNYRIVPCRLYHGPSGCTRGDFCHFIHAIGYECKFPYLFNKFLEREIPREVFIKYRNENMRKNYLDEIA
jgi:hypothetical protein